MMPNHFHILVSADEENIFELHYKFKMFRWKIHADFKHQVLEHDFEDEMIRGEKNFYALKNFIYDNPKNWNADILYRPKTGLAERYNTIYEYTLKNFFR